MTEKYIYNVLFQSSVFIYSVVWFLSNAFSKKSKIGSEFRKFFWLFLLVGLSPGRVLFKRNLYLLPTETEQLSSKDCLVHLCISAINVTNVFRLPKRCIVVALNCFPIIQTSISSEWREVTKMMLFYFL